MKFYDRTAELDFITREIQRIQDDQKSRLMLLTGRRRIGKTTLGERALQRDGLPYIYLYCPPYALEKQVASQWLEVVRSRLNLADRLKIESINDVIDVIFEEARHRPIRVFMDEVQNLPTVNPGFFAKISVQWDKLTANGISHIFMLMSTSAANPAKMFGNFRDLISARLDLKPFAPGVVKEIFQDFSPNPDPEALLALYAFTGGVPKYMKALLDKGCFTFHAMLEEMTSPFSCLWNEGDRLLCDIFKRDCGTYYAILQRIAHGVGKESLLKEGLDVESISGHLRKLEADYGLITRRRPLFSKSTRGVRRQITDNFLNFWFAFIQSNRQLVGANKIEELRSVIRSQWEDFSERALKQYFLKRFQDSDGFTHVGQWWDHKDETEIDLIAVNTDTRTMQICEIKRNPKNIDLTTLSVKAEVFIRLTPEVQDFTYTVKGLSLESLYDDSVV